jgi:diketogulonate reductase-like aldo/keto reductase
VPDLTGAVMNQAMIPAAAAGTLQLGELTVNRMGFGAMRITGPDIWGEPKDRAAARRLLVRAFELGHNFFDTADSYGPGVSESLIAEALYPYPSELVIGTKGGLVRPSRDRWDRDGRPEQLRRALDGSLSACGSNASTSTSSTHPIPTSRSPTPSARSQSCSAPARSGTWDCPV